MNAKVECRKFDGSRVVGVLIRHIDALRSVVYAGGYESLIVPRDSIRYIGVAS